MKKNKGNSLMTKFFNGRPALALMVLFISTIFGAEALGKAAVKFSNFMTRMTLEL